MFLDDLSREGIKSVDGVNFISKKFDPNSIIPVGRNDFNHVAANSKGTSLQLQIVALILDLDQFVQNLPTTDLLALAQHGDHPVVGLG